ncbi:MAG: radical SAM protein, partial [Proteobacteria bacterium]|nr:radical SAM protein [Pseudomonadota bacterium]
AELPHISVVGIAGPGDAFAEPELTLKTFELIRQRHPELMLCLSSNGLNIQAYINDLEALAARFVTLTVNAIDPVIGQKIYKHVTWNGKRITGEKAAQLLIENQLAAIRLLKAKGFVVKINSVVIPGINDCHVPFLAKVLGGMKIDFLNLLPLIPVSGTKMETIRPPTAKAIKALKEQTSRYVTHMNHCVKCRSDAAGLLVV